MAVWDRRCSRADARRRERLQQQFVDPRGTVIWVVVTVPIWVVVRAPICVVFKARSSVVVRLRTWDVDRAPISVVVRPPSACTSSRNAASLTGN